MLENKKSARFFIMMTYVGFYVLLGICGLVMVLGFPMEIIQKAAVPICSWLSFFILMIWKKKLYPEKTRKAFLSSLFRDKLEWKWMLFSVSLPVAVFIISSFVLGVILNKPMSELIVSDYASYPAMFLSNLIAGPTGEEPGWRGYYLMNSTGRRGLVKGTMMTGLLWGLWHAPLWLMEGFAPVKLLAYVGAFMFAIICFNFIISYVFIDHRNLLYCVIMHQLFNFLGGLLNTDLDTSGNMFIIYMYVCGICYAVIAAVIAIYAKHNKVTKTQTNLI